MPGSAHRGPVRAVLVAWLLAGACAQDDGAKRLHIALVNDDGWERPGIQQLKLALREAGHRVIMVGPESPQSGSGATLSVGRAALEEQGEDEYSLEASPATCAHAAVGLYASEGLETDLIVSGTNDATNIGLSATVSGTVGAVVAGLSLGIPGITSSTFSPVLKDEDPQGYDAHFRRVAGLIVELVDRLEEDGRVREDFPRDAALNVNYPALGSEALKGLRVTPQGLNSIIEISPTVSVNVSAEREEPQDTDFALYTQGYVTVTPLSPDYSATLDDGTVAALMAAREGDAHARPLRILLTSEEPWDSPGVEILSAALRADGHELTVSAPEVASSGGANRSQLSTACERVARNAQETLWSTTSPPSVCTQQAIDAMDPKPELVLSGIHSRPHLGRMLPFSGALGPATRALSQAYPAITVSVEEGGEAEFVAVAQSVAGLIAKLSESEDLLPPFVGLNLNFGELATLQDAVLTRQGRGSDFSYRFLGDGELMADDGPAIEATEDEGADRSVVAAGKLSIMAVESDWTAGPAAFAIAEILTEGLLEAAAAAAAEPAP